MNAAPRLPTNEQGSMLLGLLIVIALSAIAMMASVDVWVVERQREREQELLFVGDQYRQAIQRYFYGAPAGTPRILPTDLALLLQDDRYPTPQRHIRRLYPDPMTGNAQWGELRSANGITGIYSLSPARTIKQAGFAAADQSFTGKQFYSEWVFSYMGGGGGGAATVSAPPKKSQHGASNAVSLARQSPQGSEK